MNELIKFFKNYFLKDLLKNADLERASQEIAILNYNLNDAVQFLKKHHRKHYRMPLYLVMGPTSFGKTTLLASSGLNLTSVHGNNITNPEISTKYCHWWFAEDAVYLDTAGVYFKSDKENLHANLVWMGFLKKLKRHYFGSRISGILIVLDLPAVVASKETLAQALNDVQKRIYEIAKYTDKLPIYLIFTKCDLITGFNDFFSTLKEEELNQPFGIAFNQIGASNDTIPTFNSEFDKLIANLNSKLFPLLNKEEQLEKRLSLKLFPLQLEKLRPTIMEVVNEIPKGGHIELKGLYFTSSVQHGTPKDFLDHSIFHNKPAANKQEHNLSFNQPYFINKIFTEIINPKNKVTATEISWPQTAIIIALSVLIGSSSFIWYQNYTKSLASLKKTRLVLQNYEQTNDPEQLLKLIKELKTEQNNWYAHLGLSQVKQASNSLQKIYYTLIATTFVKQLQKTLETEITIANGQEQAELYDALKTYLMLTDPSRLNKNFVTAWFNKYWMKNYPSSAEKRESLSTQLQIALSNNIKIKPQTQIIATAREALASHNIANEESVYTSLRNIYRNQKIIFKFADHEVAVPKMYTAENFNTIYQKQITEIANSSENKTSDWVVENNGRTNLSNNEITKLITNVKAEYVRDYVNTWENALNAAKVMEFTDIRKTATILRNIANTDYPLLPLLKMIQVNTAIPGAPVAFTDLANAKFKNLNSIDLKVLDKNFAELADYFSDIANNPDPDKKAFLAAAARFQSPNTQDALSAFKAAAISQPEPIQTWMKNIALSSWQTLTAATQKYLNTTWAASVSQEYKKNIYNRYPIFKDAKESTTIESFTKFFGPNGTLDNFFKFYLKPFVDTNQVYWVWKEVDGQHLSIPQNTLEIFIRAALIQKMFFPDNTNLGVRFALNPINMSPSTRSFTLNIDGQVITYKHGQKKIDHLAWPGPVPNSSSVTFINNQGQQITTNITNDAWAWFRLVDKANLSAITNPQNYNLTFDSNGNAIKYELVAEQAINPFIPQIIDNFRCPEKL